MSVTEGWRIASSIDQVAIISVFMKNSKPFPDESWVDSSFLAADQMATCRSWLLDDNSDMALYAIGLKSLGEDMVHEGQTLGESFLDPIEQARFQSFGFAKRQREWLGGRIAAKKAALHLLTHTHGRHHGYLTLRVENDPVGRPYLLSQLPSSLPSQKNKPSFLTTNDNGALPEISITHSGGVAAALAVNGHPCGLDVQKITAKAISVQERFVAPSEQALIKTTPLLRDTGEADAFTLFWAAKESLRKAIGCEPLLGFMDVIICHLEGTPHGGMLAQCKSRRVRSGYLPPVFLILREEYACAITVNLNSALPRY